MGPDQLEYVQNYQVGASWLHLVPQNSFQIRTVWTSICEFSLYTLLWSIDMSSSKKRSFLSYILYEERMAWCFVGRGRIFSQCKEKEPEGEWERTMAKCNIRKTKWITQSDSLGQHSTPLLAISQCTATSKQWKWKKIPETSFNTNWINGTIGDSYVHLLWSI